MTLFSYVVDHDYGFSPNPYHGVCTLAHCKRRKNENSRNNLIESAKEGDWAIGTGGKNKLSAGHGKLIYAMRIDEKLTLGQYKSYDRFEKNQI